MKLLLSIYCILMIFLPKSYSQTEKTINKVEIVSIPQQILVRNGIYTEQKFDTLFSDLKSYKVLLSKDIISDSLQNLGLKINKLKKIDIRAKLVLHFNDGKLQTILVDSHGLIKTKGNVYQINQYIMNLVSFN